ncbi:MAG: TetR family transcriptional regulator [Gordonia sp. (in: high G+C Gram-positive bacteria)]|uniref:TetR/AcrR family transcriptional regulator n=1 Tax=Gordonia sp. (in: high G+C Gram-positive bacteria) TaxID=84139 RepID=UPI0039E2FEEF
MSKQDEPVRTGRRTGDGNTRDDILAAARELFASGGFGKTTMRAVATRADVDVALIPYYFTNKRGLFVAAMEMPIDPAVRIAEAADGPRETLGARLAETFLTAWDDPGSGPALQAFLRTAVTDEPTAHAFGEFVSQSIMPMVTERVGVGEDTARAVSSMMFGVATMRYLVGAPVFTAPSTADLIAAYGPRIQAVIDAD